MAYEIDLCKYFKGSEVVRHGTQSGRSRSRCKTRRRIFKTGYIYLAYQPGIKEQNVDMALSGSGIRDTSRVLGIGSSPRSKTRIIGSRASQSSCRLPDTRG